MPIGLDHESLRRRLTALLLGRGLQAAPALCRELRISQATFSRLVAQSGDAFLRVGDGRATRYAVRRKIEDVEERIPLYAIDSAGSGSRVAMLHPIGEQGFFVESTSANIASGAYPDIPYFLNELRPGGFLGRLLPRQHPELGAPSDVRLWSGNDCLRYLVRFGWNAPGNFIIGDKAYQLFLEHTSDGQGVILERNRGEIYPKLAVDVLGAGPPGSSAVGEQPKFLTVVSGKNAGARHVLVKFSPKHGGTEALRLRDLLVLEHIAHEVLRQHGQDAAKSQLIVADEQHFLEVERFDRVGAAGRRGVLALQALDAQFVGQLVTWSNTAERLGALGHFEEEWVDKVRFIELFGTLIGNTDMHFGNLSLLCDGTRLLGIAPVYDMLPARYTPLHGEMRNGPLPLPTPSPQYAAVWRGAVEAAGDFWSRAARHSLLSKGMQHVARGNQEEVENWAQIARRLPNSPST